MTRPHLASCVNRFIALYFKRERPSPSEGWGRQSGPANGRPATFCMGSEAPPGRCAGGRRRRKNRCEQQRTPMSAQRRRKRGRRPLLPLLRRSGIKRQCKEKQERRNSVTSVAQG